MVKAFRLKVELPSRIAREFEAPLETRPPFIQAVASFILAMCDNGLMNLVVSI
jgi:hypothetical protein